MKKKPVCTIEKAHGSDPANNDPRWIDGSRPGAYSKEFEEKIKHC